jgi:hypothetical protein
VFVNVLEMVILFFALSFVLAHDFNAIPSPGVVFEQIRFLVFSKEASFDIRLTEISAEGGDAICQLD